MNSLLDIVQYGVCVLISVHFLYSMFYVQISTYYVLQWYLMVSNKRCNNLKRLSRLSQPWFNFCKYRPHYIYTHSINNELGYFNNLSLVEYFGRLNQGYLSIFRVHCGHESTYQLLCVLNELCLSSIYGIS